MNSKPANVDAAPVEREGWAWALLLVLTSQAYAIWLAFTGTLEYPDYQLLAIAEMALLQLPPLIFDTRERLVERVKNFALVCLVVLPVLFLFNALLVQLLLQPAHAHAPAPWTIVAAAMQRAIGDNLRPSLIYLALSWGLALAHAFDNRTPSRWWYDNVFAERSVIPATFVLTLFLLGPVLILRQQSKWAQNLSEHSVNLALIAMMILLRIGIATMLRFGRLPTPLVAKLGRKRKRTGTKGS